MWSKIGNTEQGLLTKENEMTNKEPGYVYILTNPSFREDWVKIGKSIEMPLVPTKGTSISHIPHFVTSHDFRGDALRQEKLHQFGAELHSIENKNPIIVK